MRLLRLARLPKVNWSVTFALILLCATATVTLKAQTFSTLHSFNGTDGSAPTAGLVQATNGDIYGTTSGGGANNAGTIFKITPSGTLTTLYNFCSQTNCTDGKGPQANLVEARDGDLYGTTEFGGINSCSYGGNLVGCGTVFKVTLGGKLNTLYNFCSQSGCADGAFPFGWSDPGYGRQSIRDNIRNIIQWRIQRRHRFQNDPERCGDNTL